MNETDVLESLKHKEEELDALLREARKKASRIKEDALIKAEALRISKSKELNAMLEEYKKGEMEKIDKEAEAILTEAEKQAEEVRLRAGKNIEKVVELVVRHVLGGERLDVKG
jgi:vacuolar-type H+-ATPase subunit H